MNSQALILLKNVMGSTGKKEQLVLSLGVGYMIGTDSRSTLQQHKVMHQDELILSMLCIEAIYGIECMSFIYLVQETCIYFAL